MANTYKITAESREEFDKIAAIVDALPKLVRSQIKEASFGFAFVRCVLNTGHKKKEIIYVPKGALNLEVTPTGFAFGINGILFSAVKSNPEQELLFEFNN